MISRARAMVRASAGLAGSSPIAASRSSGHGTSPHSPAPGFQLSAERAAVVSSDKPITLPTSRTARRERKWITVAAIAARSWP